MGKGDILKMWTQEIFLMADVKYEIQNVVLSVSYVYNEFDLKELTDSFSPVVPP